MSEKILYLNHISSDDIYEVHSRDGGSVFFSITLKTDFSPTGIGKITASPRQVYDSKKRDGTIIAGKKDVLLGKPEDERKLTWRDEEKNWYSKMVSCRDLYDEYSRRRREAKKAEKKESESVRTDSEEQES